MIIYKFGGTSVGMPERMHKVADLITADNTAKIVVLSAVSGTTNALVEIGELLTLKKKQEAKEKIDILKAHYNTFVIQLYSTTTGKKEGDKIINHFFGEIEELSNAEGFNTPLNKKLLTYGELISTHLFQQYLQESNIDSTLLPALDFMYINEEGEPDITAISENLKAQLLAHNNKLYITQGFICRNAQGEIDNLKRGGSDYTASLIGAAIQAEEVQIWTDIDGMHNNDPRIVKNTFPIANLTFDEAAELAYFGAKILHPSSILPAQRHNIPVRLKSTLNHEAPGTVISNISKDIDIKAIAAKDGITAIKIKSTRMLLAHGFLRRVFEVFEKYKTSIDMITTSEVAVSVTIDDQTHLAAIIEELKHFGLVEVDNNQTIICLVGNMLSEKIGIVKKVFNALSDIPVRMVSYGGSKNNVSLLINTQHKEEALISLNDGVFSMKTN